MFRDCEIEFNAEGAGVATTRGDVNFVITEYGIAELQGKSIYQLKNLSFQIGRFNPLRQRLSF